MPDFLREQVGEADAALNDLARATAKVFAQKAGDLACDTSDDQERAAATAAGFLHLIEICASGAGYMVSADDRHRELLRRLIVEALNRGFNDGVREALTEERS